MPLLEVYTLSQNTENNIIDFALVRKSKRTTKFQAPNIVPPSYPAEQKVEFSLDYQEIQDAMRLANIELYAVIEQLEALEPSTEITQIISDIKKRIFRNAFTPFLRTSSAQSQQQVENLKKDILTIPPLVL